MAAGSPWLGPDWVISVIPTTVAAAPPPIASKAAATLVGKGIFRRLRHDLPPEAAAAVFSGSVDGGRGSSGSDPFSPSIYKNCTSFVCLLAKRFSVIK